MCMNEQIIRYELNKMEYNSYRSVGVNFVKNSSSKIATQAHWHDCYEIVFVIAGTASETINTSLFNSTVGDLFFLTPNDFHQVECQDGYECYTIMFGEEKIEHRLLKQIENLSVDSQRCFSLHTSDEQLELVKTLFLLLERELKSLKINCDVVVSSILNILISFFVREIDTDINLSKSLKNDSVSKVIKYMRDNYEKPITLTEVAKFANLNERYLSTLFVKSVGVTFKSFLSEIRLNNATRLLKTSELPMTEIAFMCGFGSISNFNRVFKSKYDMSPSEWRQKKREGVT